MKPFLLKTGIALALSLAGYLFAQIRARQAAARLRLPPSPPRPPPPAAASGESEAGKSDGGVKEDLRLLKCEEASSKFTNGTITISIAGLSPVSRSSGDEEGYLLPEFNEIVQKGIDTPGKEPDSPKTNTFTPYKVDTKEGSEMEHEIVQLRTLVQALQEREKNLEFQLLEYYGLREQETAVRELENRLKLNAMEAKLFSLKIESLQADNRRLKAQVSDYSRVVTELEAAKAKIKMLKRKLKCDSEQAKEKIEALHERVVTLRDSESTDRIHDGELERILKRFKDLEAEAAELKQENFKLAQEILDLTNKLELTQILASSRSEINEALEEASHLRQRNEELTKDLEQLQTDRCADVEELVYLRWVNACLRYELRNYQPPAGKTAARDLSKNLSPKSEEKAKQLILEYANSGRDDKLLMDFDSENCSSSHTSSLTEIGELDDASSSTRNSNSSSKTKFFSKLKHLVLGRESHSNKILPSDKTPTSLCNSGRRASISNCSFEEVTGRYSYDSGISSSFTVDNAAGNNLLVSDEHHHSKASWDQYLSRASSDVQKLRIQSEDEASEENSQHCKSEVGSSRGCKRFVLGERGSLRSPSSVQHDHEAPDSPEVSELKKFAGVLRETRGKSLTHRRSESFTLY